MKNAKGYTLVISLLLLIVMSMIGLLAVNMAVQETRIARNYEDSVVAMAWAEAGIETARVEIFKSPDPELTGFECDPANVATTTHYYPSEADPKVRYCIELLPEATRLEGDNTDTRSSGQDRSRATKTYYYKVDSYVERDTGGGTPVIIRHIQTMESQTRFTI